MNTLQLEAATLRGVNSVSRGFFALFCVSFSVFFFIAFQAPNFLMSSPLSQAIHATARLILEPSPIGQVNNDVVITATSGLQPRRFNPCNIRVIAEESDDEYFSDSDVEVVSVTRNIPPTYYRDTYVDGMFVSGVWMNLNR